MISTLLRPLGVGVLAGAGLLLEIALTRVFSTFYYPPYVFVVLSLAVLGIGLGAAFVAWRPGLAAQSLLVWYAAVAGAATLLLLAILLVAPGAGGGILQFALLAAPFGAVGMALATLFALDAAASPFLYRADLAGAGLGALLAVPLLDAVGVVNAVLVAAVLFGVAGLLLAERFHPAGAASAVGCFAVLIFNVSTPVFILDWQRSPTEKPILRSLSAGGAIASRWDAFARTDLVDPGEGRPWELYMDGAAGSVMPPAGGDPALWRDIGFFPFATEQPERVFLIGPGGGADVWFARQGRAEEIVAVEVNRAAVDLVREFGDYNGNLYDGSDIRVVVGEGRHLLEQDDQRYDLIFLSHVLTLTAERTGFSLVENRALTIEAFAAYLEHLQPGGQLALKLYDEATLTRALATVLAVLRAQGLDDANALKHVLVLVDNNVENSDDNPEGGGIPLLLVRDTPYTHEDSLSLGAVAREVGFTPLFLPGVLANPPLDAVAEGARTFEQVVAASDQNLAPTTDNRPFFYLFERGLPDELQRLLWILIPVVVLGAGVVIGLDRRLPVAARCPWAPLYFAALGMGFMLVEIAVIQQTQQLLGQPTQALTVVLATLLVAGGLGSGFVGRRVGRAAWWIPPAVAAAILLWAGLWPGLVSGMIKRPYALQVTVAIAALAPLAFFMGAPFPLGLRSVGAYDRRHVALGWSVNGLMSVVGSALGIALAVTTGYSSVLLAGVGAYILAALVAPKLTD